MRRLALWIILGSVALPVMGPANTVGAAAAGRDWFTVPAAALVRPLGVIPPHPASSKVGFGDIPAAGGRGVPLGGIGAGSFMINQAGTFGPWEFRNGLHEERILPQAAFHVREQPSGKPAVVRTLATPGPLGKVLPAWHGLAPGDGTTAALYPFGWNSYKPFSADVSMRYWSPIVAREDERTSLPVAYFDMRLANHTSTADTVSVMFTFPNAPLCVSGPRPCTRTGLSSRVSSDPATGVTGVTMSADAPGNVTDAQKSEWTVAVPTGAGKTSYATSWNGAGNGSDIQRAFARTGILGNTAIDASHSAAAMAVSVTLQPNQVTTVPFTLAWDFPQVLFGSQTGPHTTWMRRYTSFFGGRETAGNDYIPGSYPFHQSFAIANRALAGESLAYQAVHGWWDRIALDSAYPLWLRQAALNELYYDTFGGTFWESGMVQNTYPCGSNPQAHVCGAFRIGSRVPGTHLFFNMESPRFPNAESYDVRAYEVSHFDELFPNIERDVQRAWSDFVAQDPAGHPPHDAGGPHHSPYVVWPDSSSGNFAANWQDLPPKYIIQVWQYVHATGDTSLLDYAYPSMLRAYQWTRSHLPPGGHLPADSSIDTTYDTWPLTGNNSYVGGLWILDQEIMEAGTRQAVADGVPGASLAFAGAVASDTALSRSQFESSLWSTTGGGHYRIDTGDPYGTGIMADATLAQHAAEAMGLPDVVGDPTHLHAHLLTAYARLVAPWHDSSGGCVGVANGANADGTPLIGGGHQPSQVWTGVSYYWGATAYLDGVRFGDPVLTADGLKAASCIAHQTYDVAANGYAFDTPELWSTTDVTNHGALQYQRPRAVWELLLAIKDPLAGYHPGP